MKTRRQFATTALRFLAGAGLAVNPILSVLQSAFAAVQRRLLPKGTDLQSLTHEHPSAVDARNLDIMPIEAFNYEKVKDFTPAEVAAGKVFLAYPVNGQACRRNTGFPCGWWPKTVSGRTGSNMSIKSRRVDKTLKRGRP